MHSWQAFQSSQDTANPLSCQYRVIQITIPFRQIVLGCLRMIRVCGPLIRQGIISCGEHRAGMRSGAGLIAPSVQAVSSCSTRWVAVDSSMRSTAANSRTSRSRAA